MKYNFKEAPQLQHLWNNLTRQGVVGGGALGAYAGARTYGNKGRKDYEGKYDKSMDTMSNTDKFLGQLKHMGVGALAGATIGFGGAKALKHSANSKEVREEFAKKHKNTPYPMDQIQKMWDDFKRGADADALKAGGSKFKGTAEDLYNSRQGSAGKDQGPMKLLPFIEKNSADASFLHKFRNLSKKQFAEKGRAMGSAFKSQGGPAGKPMGDFFSDPKKIGKDYSNYMASGGAIMGGAAGGIGASPYGDTEDKRKANAFKGMAAGALLGGLGGKFLSPRILEKYRNRIVQGQDDMQEIENAAKRAYEAHVASKARGMGSSEWLGLDKKMNAREVKRRINSLNKKFHPDTGGSAEDFRELTKAKEDVMGSQWYKDLK